MEVKDNPRLLQSYRTVALLGGAVGVSVVIYAALTEFWLWSQPTFRGYVHPAALRYVRPLIITAAAALLLLAGWVRGRLLGIGGSLESMVAQAMLPQQRSLAMMRAAIIGFAMCEGAALLGLLLFLCSGRRWDFYVVAAMSLIGLALRFPSYRQWQRWYGSRSSIR